MFHQLRVNYEHRNYLRFYGGKMATQITYLPNSECAFFGAASSPGCANFGSPIFLKHPITLPRKSYIKNLLIRQFHERIRHKGRGMTNNEIRPNRY